MSVACPIHTLQSYKSECQSRGGEERGQKWPVGIEGVWGRNDQRAFPLPSLQNPCNSMFYSKFDLRFGQI
ncbi:hypothetical protein L2E82_01908 [Cichorium intybus]|uniref:Uncharacterized protein n=1 Tax=Cichorium intybus TaxID=13427 RepID=A0ACB9H073_CICIN|nr:hypothetical protein L2E82_01908 [Cichorium intybus]